jgi:hypothetical protein
MAVGMIGGPRLCEPLLATGLGRFTYRASIETLRKEAASAALIRDLATDKIK